MVRIDSESPLPTHAFAAKRRGILPPFPTSSPNMQTIAIFLSTSGHSGVDRAMQHLIPELASRGYRVDLLKVRKHGPNLESVPDGVRIVDLGSSHTYSSIPAVVRYLKQEQPDVLLADKDRVNRSALLAKFLARASCRLILSSGTTISIDLAHRGAFERWLQRFSMGKLYRLADSVIVTSHGVADDMAAYAGLPRHLIKVVPSPVVPDNLLSRDLPRPDHPWFKEGEPPVILSVGELGARKDYATLVRAFAQARRERECRLMIIGRGKQHQMLLDLAEELGVADAFALPGFIADPYPYMAYASVFAFTSRWEGLGFVLIEALAVGTPVVSTDCPSGPAEILQGGRYGPLIEIGDDQALATKIIELLHNPPDRDFLRQAALPYTISASADAYLHAFGIPA